MSTLLKFEHLDCWQSARQLNIGIFSALEKNKLNNNWSLKDQLTRAALSIMNNIAEGYGRFSYPEKIRFFNIANASCNEVKSMLYLIQDLKYFKVDESEKLQSKLDKTQGQILGYIKYLNQKNPQNP